MRLGCGRRLPAGSRYLGAPDAVPAADKTLGVRGGPLGQWAGTMWRSGEKEETEESDEGTNCHKGICLNNFPFQWSVGGSSFGSNVLLPAGAGTDGYEDQCFATVAISSRRWGVPSN